MTSERKPCLGCFEPIDVRARKCPHCHQVQARVATVVNHPAFLIGAFVVLALVVIFAFWTILHDLRREPFKAQLVLGAPSLRVSESERRVTCFADITNKDTALWSRPSFQAEFFDGAGALVDVHYARETFAVYPTFTAKGRVSGSANSSLSDYVSCKFSILNAE